MNMESVGERAYPASQMEAWTWLFRAYKHLEQQNDANYVPNGNKALLLIMEARMAVIE